jgi:signal transduction histidine kinase
MVITWQVGKQKELLDQLREKNDLLRQRNDQIEQQRAQLQSLNATKDRFFSIIAHDLRGPLGSIQGLIDVIKESNSLDPKLNELFSKLNRATLSTSNLLNNLLKWAMTQTGEIPFKPFPLNLYNLIAETIQTIGPVADAKKITIDFDVDPETFCVGDGNMLRTVFRNLLSNAIAFTPLNGTITIRSDKTEAFIFIAVEDNGIGMSEAQVVSLFDFDKNDPKRKKEDESRSGLGLILCKDFIDLHEGKISVESKMGKGSTFTVRLKRYYPEP